MTREHKLALIIGFALVLVVGLLITDNVFSTAKKSEPGGPTAQEIKQPIFDERVLVERPQSNQPTVTPVASNPPVEPVPSPLVMGTNQPGGGTDFGTRLGEAWNSTITDLGNGHVETGAAAQLDAKPVMGADPKAGFQTPESTTTPARQPGNDSLFNTPQPVTPDTVPGAPKSSGLNGAGSDLDGLGVPAPKPVETQITPTEPKSSSKDKTYQIASGDTFWKIAKREYGDGSLAESLKTYNAGRIGKNGQLRVGASLLLPEKSALKGGASGATGGSAKASELKVPSRETIEKTAKKDEPKKTDSKKPETASKKATTYTVQKGDTLEKIAKKMLGSASRVEDLLKANRGVLDNEDEVQVGQVLKIPAR